MEKFSKKAALSILAAATLLSAPISVSAEQNRFYVVSNKADGNTVVGFQDTGTKGFSKIGEYKTGGTGTGDLEIPAL